MPDAGILLVAGGGDLVDDIGNALHAGEHLLHRGAGLVDQLAAGADLVHGILDQGFDFLGRCRGALREAAHFRRNHSKTAALFTGASGFDGGIQREDVGLERNAIDDGDDVDDLARRCIDVAHRPHHLRHDGTTAGGHVRRGAREIVGLCRILRILLDGAGEFLHRGGGFFQ
ncbi:hypothetical protein AYR66_08520 [Noviherbaspirillum denitrificans]|uniref:Uncharacterized protein n=1 Tax=Noviherbaspirillum denitrificans TaxID=1968433 RepID=A0A254TE09_9BURK|nr:hypothetical protein AYR66_08520 [Noviherbaspirillum denitrificans]